MSRFGMTHWHTGDETALVKVTYATLLDDPSRVVVSIFTDVERDGVVHLQMSRRQLAQFCQQVDGVWVDEFMAREVSE